MKIHGLVVSVNYAPELAKSIGLWMNGLESLVVVTDLVDDATVELADKHGVTAFRTDAFTRHGAHFNKGMAQQEAWECVPKDDWLLSIDADVIPPADWKEQVERANPQLGFLHGCYRYEETGRRIADDTHGYGYFQLFHASDPIAQRDPFFDTFWYHAGNGDSMIMLRWRDCGKLAPPLPLKLVHPGGKSENWFGRGEREKFEAMQRERRRRGGGWPSIQHERINL